MGRHSDEEDGYHNHGRTGDMWCKTCGKNINSAACTCYAEILPSHDVVDDVVAAPAAAEQMPRSIAYRGDIDGLRALAVIPVVLFHFEVPGFDGGFTGVDVFFVISGFLITSIIMASVGKGTFSPLGFWTRRIRRLFPASAAVIIFVMIAGHYYLLGEVYQDMATSIWAILLLGGNIHFYKQTGYNSPAAIEVPLLHCWSLAVEEQFYLLFPGMLWLLLRTRNDWAFPVAAVALSLISFIISVVYTWRNPSFAFYLLPARVWEMLVGGLLAAVVRHRRKQAEHTGAVVAEEEEEEEEEGVARAEELKERAVEPSSSDDDHGVKDEGSSDDGGDARESAGAPLLADRRVAEVVSVVGVGLIVASFFGYDRLTPYPGYQALLPCAGTLLFLACQDEEHVTYMGQALAMRGATFIGQISYSLYLWHWPIYVFQAYNTPEGKLSSWETVFGIALSFCTAVVSYFCVENVFRKKQHVPNRVFYPLAALLWALLFTLALLFSLGVVRPGIHGGLVDIPPPAVDYSQNTFSYYRPNSTNQTFFGNFTNVTITNVTNVTSIVLVNATNCTNITVVGSGNVTVLDNVTTTVNGTNATAGNTTTITRNVTEVVVVENSTITNSTVGNCTTVTYYTTVTRVVTTTTVVVVSPPAPPPPPPVRCLVYLTDAQLDALYDVPLTSILESNILATKGWDAGRFNYFNNGHRPYIAGPPGTPSIAILGTSHAAMWGPVIERLAGEYGVTVGFLVADGDHGRFKSPLSSWDSTRLSHLDAWAPDMIAWIDFWAGDVPSQPWWYEGYDFDYALGLITPRASRVKVFGDVPTLPITKTPSNNLFKNTVYQTYRDDGNFEFLLSWKEDADYGARRLVVERAIEAAAGRVDATPTHFIEMASLFTKEPSGDLQLVNPYIGTLVYKDFGHVNVDGAERAEQLFRKELFDEFICP